MNDDPMGKYFEEMESELRDVFRKWSEAIARAEKAEAALATARIVTHRLLDGWKAWEGDWVRLAEWVAGYTSPREPMSDAERAWLASVAAAPPAMEESDDHFYNGLPGTLRE